MGFAENYLKLRDQRRGPRSTGGNEQSLSASAEDTSRAVVSQAAKAPAGSSFAENYLKLRKERASGVPKLSLPEAPAAWSGGTQKAPEWSDRTVPGLSLPTAEKKQGGLLQGILDILGETAYSGDSTLPMNATTQAIGGIRNDPEGVERALAEQKELAAKKAERTAQAAAWAREDPLGASAASVLTAPLSSADYLQRLVEMNAIGQTVPREDLAPGEVTQALRSGASQDMGAVGKFLYNTGMSGVDSLAASWLGGGLSGMGGAILAGGAAASAANDIKERGGTDEQALVGGAVSGIFESLFESLSIGQLDALKEAPADSVRTLLTNLAKNTLTNASEEAATELANTVFDRLYMGELSNYTSTVKAAIEAGMSEREARAAAMKEAAADIGMSALSGGLMGAGMGAAGSAMGAFGSGQAQSAWLSRQTEKAQDTAYRTMAERGLFSPEASQAARNAVARMDRARKRSGLEVPGLIWNGSPSTEAETGREGPSRPGEVSGYPQAENAPQRQSNAASEAGGILGGGQSAANAASESSVKRRAGEALDIPQAENAPKAAENAALPGLSETVFSKGDRALLDRLGKITGANIRVVSGEELARLTGQRGANGVQMGGQIYLSADADRPLMEVARHELTHRLQETAPEAYGAFRDYVAGVYRESGTLESYLDGLRRSREGAGLPLTEEQALDEIAADYAGSLLADENAVRRLAGEDRGLLERMLDGLRDFIRKIRDALGGQPGRAEPVRKAQRAAQGHRDSSAEVQELERAAQLWQAALEESAARAGEGGQEAGEARYSIGYDRDNRPFVTVEEDILEGIPQKDWVRTVKDNLRKKFPNGVTVGNSQIEIDGTSRREMTWSGYSQWLQKVQPDIFADKMRATNNAGEILQASRNYINEGLHHPRKDSIQDFARGTVQLRVGENEYTADVIVGTRNNGIMMLYDLLNLKPVRIQEKSQGRQTATPSPGPSRNTATDSIAIIPPSGLEVKGLSLPTPEDVSKSDTLNDKQTRTLAASEIDGLHQRTSSPVETILSQPAQDVKREVPGLSLPDVSNLDTSETAPLSMAGDAELKREIERLKRQNQRLKEQMKRTDAPRRNREAVVKEAGKVLREYNSAYDSAELAGRLQTLWDHQADRYGGAPWVRDRAPTQEEIRHEAKSIALDILANNEEQVNELFDRYSSLRKELRTRGISIAPEYRADLESADGYEAIRKRYFGKLKLSKNGAAVDQVYDDLALRYPELFPDDIVHPADQLLRITDVLDELEPVIGNRFEQEMEQSAEYLAGELLERFYDVPQKALTFADKQAKKMAEARKKDQEEFNARLYRKKRETETRIKRVQEKFQEADRKRIENQNAAQRRETIRRHANRLSRMLLRPTDKRHIPEELRGAVLGFVQSLNLESGYSKDLTGNRIYAQEGEQLGYPTKRSEAARALQGQYKALAEKGGFTIDPDMEDYLSELAGMEDIPLSKLNKSQLDTVWKVMRVVEQCVSRSDELLGQSRYATVSEMAERIKEQNGRKKDRKNFVGLAGAADQLLNMDMLTPETYFHKLGEAGESLFKQMRSAADRQTTVLKEGVERAQALTKESGMDLRKAEKDLHTFSTSGGKLTLSTAQIMELYTLSKREQALEHIYIGGLKPQGARKGLTEAGRAAPVKVTPSDVAEILETLTPEQRHLADGLQAYLSGDLARHGNDASMTVYGYEKFKEENYWPIKVDRNQTKSDVKKEAESKTVAGYGMTKALKPNAANAVVLRGILDSYTDHLNQMATYAGWLSTSEDVNRVHNFQFTDEDGNPDGTMKTLLEQIYGRGGNKYLDSLMSDIALGTKAGAEPSFSDRGLNQFKAAKVGGNLRVILQQPTAILRAASMIDPKYFLTAKNPMKGWDTAKKYAPIAQWKDWGYFELDTGRNLKDLIAGESSRLDAVKNKLMEPAGMADSVAWGHLWNAVEAETAAKHKDLKRDSEDFYQAAAERFGDIIDRTQVVDSVLHRTQIMRSGNSMTRMATSFMSEPSKIYNMVARDLYDIQAAGSAKDRTQAGKNLARSAISLIASFAVNAVAQSLPDMWRDKDRDKALKEKFTDAYVGNFLENFDPVGYVPFLKDFESIVQGYSVDRSDLEGFSDVVNALGQMHKAWTGEGRQSRAAAALELACKGGDMLGLPMSNVKREIAGIIQTALQGMGDVEAQYKLDKLGLNPDKASSTFYGDLYRAMGKDWEQYGNIYQDMIGKGWDEENLKDNMTKRMSKEAGLEKPSSLPIEYSPPGTDRSFDQELRRQLEKGGTWMDTLPEGTLEQARALDGLEPEEGADSVTKMQKIQELRDSVWGNDVKDLFLSRILSQKEYEQFQKARKAGVGIEKWCGLYESISREKVRRTGKTGSPSQADVSAALERSGLTEKQKDAVWDSYGWEGERPEKAGKGVSETDTSAPLKSLSLPDLKKSAGEKKLPRLTLPDLW